MNISKVLDAPKLHHSGIICPDEETVFANVQLLGLTEEYRGYVPQWGALCIFMRPNGGSPVEFVVPDADTKLAKFNKGMGGVHHVAFEIPDIGEATEKLNQKGVRMIEPEAIKGAGNFLCNFISPVFTRGIMVELVEELSRTG